MRMTRLPTHHFPLLAFLIVSSTVWHHKGGDVEVAAVVLPRLVDEDAALLIERKLGHVDRAMR